MTGQPTKKELLKAILEECIAYGGGSPLGILK